MLIMGWFLVKDFFSLQEILDPVLSAVGERYYKVTAEALRVCGELVKVIRPNVNEVSWCRPTCKLLFSCHVNI